VTAAPILVIGRSGQVASALAGLSAIAAHQLICAGRPDVDLGSPDTLSRLLARHDPCLVINAAAYTAVDKAETERDHAFAINAEGPGNLAALCADRDVPLIHFSTDYVFDGTATRPYREDDPTSPLGVYGASKAAGEAVIRRACTRHLILRTAWVYSASGHNFLRTMLRLGAERDELAVVDDQRGSPTYAADIAWAVERIALALLRDAGTAQWGTYHLTNSGETTWFGFAQEIFRLSAAKGNPAPRVRPIASRDYPTPARRPAYSVLDGAKLERAFNVSLPPWRDGVARCMALLP